MIPVPEHGDFADRFGEQPEQETQEKRSLPMSAWKVCICAFALAFLVGSARATLIDSFTAGKQALFVSADGTTDSNQANLVTGVIGGYRDLALEWIRGEMDFANTLPSAGKFAFTQGTSEGKGSITWDGENSQGTLGYGLAQNLAAGGTNEFFLSVLNTAGTGVALTMTIYTDATHASSCSGFVAGGFTGGKEFLYGDFTKATGMTGPVNFASVGAIKLDFNGDGHTGSDITLGLIQTRAVPEPPTLAFVVIGAMAVIWGWRRLRSV
jgi:hypothetical protein